RHTRCLSDWSSDVCSSDLGPGSASLPRGFPEVTPTCGLVYSLIHVLAAVDGNVRAGDERGFLRAQIDNQAGDLRGLAEPPERDLRQDLRVENFLRNGGDHLRADVARRDGI